MALKANDGVASLPVFKGPFPETENMRFLSQVDPEDLGAKPVPGVWAKGMMNDLWGWTSPDGEEYALATNSGGIAIVRVTDPAHRVRVEGDQLLRHLPDRWKGARGPGLSRLLKEDWPRTLEELEELKNR